MFDTCLMGGLAANDELVRSKVKPASVNTLQTLRRALAVSRYGRPSAVAARVKRDGPIALSTIEDEVANDISDDLESESARLLELGVRACLLGSRRYPEQLAATRSAPPVLYYRGAIELLTAPGIGMCGSRKAGDVGLRAASSCGEAASQQGLTVVSGYARGVDMAGHLAALKAGGRTVIVLAEGIDRFRVKSGDFAQAWDPARALVVSQFAPSQPWSAGNAMSRNGVIIGISQALVVVEAGETGGTLAAGRQALKEGRAVYVLALDSCPAGNTELLANGAIPIRSRAELDDRLSELRREGPSEFTLA